MSTTIDVLPTTAAMPLVEQTRSRAEQLYRALLYGAGVQSDLRIEATIGSLTGGGRLAPIAPLDLPWSTDMHLCFTYVVDGTPRCSSWPSCTYWLDDDSELEGDLWWPLTELTGRIPAARLQAARGFRHYWSEYRNAGGPAIASIGYGLVAAAIAEMTDGIIGSWDSAFDGDEHNGESAAAFLGWWGERQLSWYGIRAFTA